eukprot:239157_1
MHLPFGGFNGVLNFLIHNGNQQQLTDLYSALQNIKYDQYEDVDEHINIVDHPRVNMYCGFKQLSVEISCIIDFLPRNSVQTFKATSRKIAIVCLQEMNKIPVRVCNMNKFIDHKYKNMHMLSLSTCISSPRYPPNMSCSTLG